jgi:enoyl-CoA hydratase
MATAPAKGNPMTDQTAGRVHADRHDHIYKIVIDNPAKKNAFSPDMMQQLSEALTTLENDADLWVGVLCAAGDHFTAGLDMPKFFGPTATAKGVPEGNIDPFGLKNQCTKPIVSAVQGIVFTIGIELMLAGDIVVAASDCRFCQMESKRGIAPLGGAHFRYITRAGWGDAPMKPAASGWSRKSWRPERRPTARWKSRGSSPATHRWAFK